jgi:hypothetical protein
MPGIFDKWPPSWKMLSTIYKYSRQVDLIGNFHNFIFKLRKSNWNIVVMSCSWKLLVKKGVFSTSAKPHPNPHGNPQSIKHSIKALQKKPHMVM